MANAGDSDIRSDDMAGSAAGGGFGIEWCAVVDRDLAMAGATYALRRAGRSLVARWAGTCRCRVVRGGPRGCGGACSCEAPACPVRRRCHCWSNALCIPGVRRHAPFRWQLDRRHRDGARNDSLVRCGRSVRPSMRLYRSATRSSSSWVAAKTAASIVVVWSLALWILPVMVDRVARRWVPSWTRFDPVRPLAVGLFIGGSVCGLSAAISMTRHGHGTPLPFDAATELVHTGMYAVVRNPMAVSAICQSIGVGVWFGHGRSSDIALRPDCSGTP
jgi:protein-S-isoprenylcysteine O-methyltransferase Ste14